MRPLSPHLLIYKLPFPALMSITHRITGIGFILNIYLFLWWLYALVNQGSALLLFKTTLQHSLIQPILIGMIFSSCFHFFNGMRYFFWSLGFGFNLRHVYISGYFIIALTMLSTLYIWFYI